MHDKLPTTEAVHGARYFTVASVLVALVTPNCLSLLLSGSMPKVVGIFVDKVKDLIHGKNATPPCRVIHLLKKNGLSTLQVAVLLVQEVEVFSWP